MLSVIENLEKEKLPRHIAIIMDGNGRWAKKRGAARVFGHRNAIKSVREVTEGCAELGIEYLTLYAFSTENWGRPQKEISGLMQLLVSTLRKEIRTLTKNNVKLGVIGDVSRLPKECQTELVEACEETKSNTGLNLILALNYSGRWEIIDAVNKFIKEGKGTEISEDQLKNYLNTSNVPDPELVIRTSGEKRISNFLLWQIAYSELYFTDVLWPDFRKSDLIDAIKSYSSRERRFGKLSEQVN